jgi:hypothetical protein
MLLSPFPFGIRLDVALAIFTLIALTFVNKVDWNTAAQLRVACSAIELVTHNNKMIIAYLMLPVKQFYEQVRIGLIRRGRTR